MAAAPASSMRRRLANSRLSGEGEATSGFFSSKPRYVVLRSIVFSCREIATTDFTDYTDYPEESV
jgi:hypothetical protein